jgi:hypothetical protein
MSAEREEGSGDLSVLRLVEVKHDRCTSQDSTRNPRAVLLRSGRQFERMRYGALWGLSWRNPHDCLSRKGYSILDRDWPVGIERIS